jgi:hypothetical protein
MVRSPVDAVLARRFRRVSFFCTVAPVRLPGTSVTVAAGGAGWVSAGRDELLDIECEKPSAPPGRAPREYVDEPSDPDFKGVA